jgi:soluble lytic murein transglycosylase-like protein
MKEPKFTWANESNGVVQISINGDNYVVPTIVESNPNFPAYKRALRYRPFVEKHCGRMPQSWAVAVIFAEDSGEKDVSLAGATGVMQVLPETAGMTTMQLMNVENNIHAGCKVLRRLASLPGADLVSVASMYNAGESNGRPHQSDKSPFGFAEAHGYILRVLSANNEFLLRDAS